MTTPLRLVDGQTAIDNPEATSLDRARRYVDFGLSVISIQTDGSKSPAVGTWKTYQDRQPSQEELRQMFRGDRGIAILGGKVSGNLEILDFDKPGIFIDWRARTEKADPWIAEVLDELPHVRTPAGGDHVYYRCQDVAGSLKLAIAAKPFTDCTGKQKTVLIETKGEGGYVVGPGSPLSCHEAGKPYELLNGSLAAIPTITVEQRRTLLDAARSLDEKPKTTKPTETSKTCDNAGGRPGDDFAARHQWSELLEAHGWKKVGGRGDVTDWRRPGKKDRGASATTNHAGSDLLYIFSSNAEPFEPDTSYSKFAAFALLEHEGDFKKAAKALARRGYGKQNAKAKQKSGASSETERETREPQAPPCTDTGNAERLVRDHGEDLHYNHPWKKWLAWDGTRWASDATAEVQRRAKGTVRGIYREASEIEDDDLRKGMARWARKSESVGARRAMIELAASEEGIPVLPEELDRDPTLLNCTSGTIALEAGELRPHRREDLITKRINVAFDPKATAPRFEQFLSEVMGGNSDLVAYLHRLLGYSITGDVREQVLPFLYGGGSNGKSTLLDAVRELLGSDYACEASPDLLMLKRGETHPTERAFLYGKRFVSTTEVEEGRRLAEVSVKSLTGGDQVTARRMREDFWSFKPTHKLLLCANHKPQIFGTDRAIWRRIHLIPFNVSFEGREDRDLPAKLRAEQPGILAWLVRGCIAWQTEGLDPPAEVLTATDDYRKESDVVGDFIADGCVVNDACKVKSGELYEAFMKWHKAAIGGDAMSQRALCRRLTERGYTRDRTKSSRQWVGIGLLCPGDATKPETPPGDATKTEKEPQLFDHVDH